MRLGAIIANEQYRGRCFAIRNGKHIGRCEDTGKVFVGRSTRGRKKKTAIVRIKEDGVYLSQPALAERVKHGWKIIGDEPIWRGQTVPDSIVEVCE